MRKQEQRLWDTMRNRAPSDAWLQRVENVAGEGMPDVMVTLGGVVSFVELKAPAKPARARTPLLGANEGLRRSQINWHLKAASEGIRGYVLVRAHNDLNTLALVASDYAIDMNTMTTRQMLSAAAATDWEAIYATLQEGHSEE